MKSPNIFKLAMLTFLVLTACNQDYAYADTFYQEQVLINNQIAIGTHTMGNNGFAVIHSCPNPLHYRVINSTLEAWACLDTRLNMLYLDSLAPHESFRGESEYPVVVIGTTQVLQPSPIVAQLPVYVVVGRDHDRLIINSERVIAEALARERDRRDIEARDRRNDRGKR